MTDTFRALDNSLGQAVAARTILRKLPDGTLETWRDVACRVAQGNTLLTAGHDEEDLILLQDHIAYGRILMSGRHLQHGDLTQPQRNIEVFTNCATAPTTFGMFYLLLNGSGVGRSYDDDLMLVDWSYLPEIVPVIAKHHPDYQAATYQWHDVEQNFCTPEEAENMYSIDEWIIVDDSREGWAKVIEKLETMAFSRMYYRRRMAIDFTRVRPKGASIAGMQNRPSSGPVPLMQALMEMMLIRNMEKKMPRWEQTMRIDHALASCVVVGGARRSARMSVKDYRDRDIIDFINIKENEGLWSSNNSIAVDAAFWEQAQVFGTRSRKIFEAACNASYYHGSAEPGFINVDKLHRNDEGMDIYSAGHFMGTKKYKLNKYTLAYEHSLVGAALCKQYNMIVNPCGEIPLSVLGGYCCLADVVPFHAETLEQALDAFKHAARALVRTNLMPAFYDQELARTNRIGVGFTGIFEFAWKFFTLTWVELIDEDKSKEFWDFLAYARRVVEDEATEYSKSLNLNTPHTFTTVKPAGTTSKLYMLTEGAHLPAMTHYIRYVQFQKEDPLIDEYESKGYEVIRSIPHYHNVSLVGFPTVPTICKLGIPPEQVVTADEACLEDQYKWISLIEKYWLGEGHNAQVSYTAKYNKNKVNYTDYQETILEWQPKVRCLSVMPTSDHEAIKKRYGYLPETPVSKEVYNEAVRRINGSTTQHITLEELQCTTGACPI